MTLTMAKGSFIPLIELEPWREWLLPILRQQEKKWIRKITHGPKGTIYICVHIGHPNTITRYLCSDQCFDYNNIHLMIRCYIYSSVMTSNQPSLLWFLVATSVGDITFLSIATYCDLPVTVWHHTSLLLLKATVTTSCSSVATECCIL
jgi:hypothetical protein